MTTCSTVWVAKPSTVADLHTKVPGARPPPTGPNSFVFTYVFTEKHLCRRLAPPTGNPGSAPGRDFYILLKIIIF